MQIKLTKRLIEFEEKKVLSFFWKDKEFHFTPFIFNKCWSIWYQTKKPRCTSSVTRQVNPLPRWIHQIQWRLELWYAKLKDKNAKQCTGCGEGVAIYEIIDPNDHNVDYKRLFANPTEYVRLYTGEKTKVCKGCVYFYDMHGSSIPLRNNKEFHVDTNSLI